MFVIVDKHQHFNVTRHLSGLNTRPAKLKAVC